jgi:class 3 adenylate cyclase
MRAPARVKSPTSDERRLTNRRDGCDDAPMDRARPVARSFDDPDERRQLPGMEFDVIRMGDLHASRAITEPGWRWSTHVKPIVGTASCEVQHRSIVVSGHMRVQMDSGEIVDLVPGGIYVVPPGHDAWVVGDEPAVMVDISGTSGEFGVPASGERVLATLVFTDIVGSTPLAQRLGDQRWKRLIAEHDRVIADTVDRFRGRIVNSTGDGVFARFEGPARALQAAQALVAAMAALELDIRVGVHTGEVEVVGNDVRGVTVHEAARIMALGGPGEIIVSDVTRQLATGVGLTFEDSGDVELRGVSGTRHIYRLEGPH